MKKVLWGGIAIVAIAFALLLTRTANANSQACANRVNNTHAKLLECITVEGVRKHQAAFQAIADANNGIRTSGTPGYDRSVDYVVAEMQAAGYNVTVQPFQFQTFISLSPSLLEQVAPPPIGPIVNNITLIASCAMVKFGVHGVSEEDGVTKQPSKGEHHERHVDYNRICCH